MGVGGSLNSRDGEGKEFREEGGGVDHLTRVQCRGTTRFPLEFHPPTVVLPSVNVQLVRPTQEFREDKTEPIRCRLLQTPKHIKI